MLIIRKEAEYDLLKAFDWYEHQQRFLGNSFLSEVESVFEVINETPINPQGIE